MNWQNLRSELKSGLMLYSHMYMYMYHDVWKGRILIKWEMTNLLITIYTCICLPCMSFHICFDLNTCERIIAPVSVVWWQLLPINFSFHVILMLINLMKFARPVYLAGMNRMINQKTTQEHEWHAPPAYTTSEETTITSYHAILA